MPEFTGRLRTPRLAAPPATPNTGEMYYDTGLNALFWWNGSAWVQASGGAGGLPADSVVPAATRVISNKLLAGDTQSAFRFMGDGKHEWGPGGTTAVDTNLYRSAANQLATDSLFDIRGSVSTYAFTIRQGTETWGRLDIKNDGKVEWGPGGASAPDTNLYRSAADTLKTDDHVIVGGNLDLSWVSGQIRIGGDTNLYRTTAGTLKTDGTLYANAFLSNTEVYSGQGTANQLLMHSNGRLYFGGANDTYLYRFQATELRTDGYIGAGLALKAGVAANRTDQYGGVLFGATSDTNLYRAAAGQLKTDGVFFAGGAIASGVGTAGQMQITSGTTPTILFGLSGDTNLYRSGAAVLRTDGYFQANLIRSTVGASGNGALLACRGAGGNSLSFDWTGSVLQFYVDGTLVKSL